MKRVRHPTQNQSNLYNTGYNKTHHKISVNNGSAQKQENSPDYFQRASKLANLGVLARPKSRAKQKNGSSNKAHQIHYPMMSNSQSYASLRETQRNKSNKIRGAKKLKNKNRTRNIMQESSLGRKSSSKKLRLDPQDISSISVDDIISAATFRRKLDEKEGIQIAPKYHTPENNQFEHYNKVDIGDDDSRNQGIEQVYVRSPPLKTQTHRHTNTSQLIEKKIEEVLTKLMQNPQIQSLQKPRGNILSHSLSDPQYWPALQRYPSQPQFNTSYETVQPMFHSQPNSDYHNNLSNLK